MSPRKRTRSRLHRLQLSDRVATLTVREEATRTVMKLRFTKYGPFGGADEQAFGEWITPITHAYDGDGKPVVMDHPFTGQVATIFDPIGPFPASMVITRPEGMH